MTSATPDALALAPDDEVNEPLPSRRQFLEDAITRGDGQIIPLLCTANWLHYWRIWIVNAGLTVLTLGIYSAWAKVRTRRYFYGHISVQGSSFEYHGQALAILKGRLIAAGLFILWFVCNRIGAIWVWMALTLFVMILPWLVVKAARFRAANSSWRSLRFSFVGSVKRAFRIYTLPWLIIGGLLASSTWVPVYPESGEHTGAIAVFGILLVLACLSFPFMLTAQKRFLINHHRFGDGEFSFDNSAVSLLATYFLAILISLPLQILSYNANGLTQWASGQLFPLLMQFIPVSWLLSEVGTALMLVLLSPLILLAASPVLFGLGFLRGSTMVWQWDGTRLGQHGFLCELNPWTLAWFYFSNAVVIALSFGLMIPWAITRTTRLRAQSLQLVCIGTLDEWVSLSSASSNAVGDEVGEFAGIDIGL